MTECYGLVSGPAWWRVTFVGELENHGYLRHPHAPCLMYLPCEENDKSRDSKNDGVLCIRTDDMLEAGNARHRSLMERFVNVLTSGSTNVCWITLTGPYSMDVGFVN